MIHRHMLKSKIHRATVTEADVDYSGSITVDKTIMEAADIVEHEKVHVLSLSSGIRLETYVISGDVDKGQICINGAAAKLISEGEKVIILSYAVVSSDEVASYSSKVVLLDENNKITAIKEKGVAFDLC